MLLIHSIPGSPTQRARWGLGQCYTSSELTTEIFQIKLADSWVLAGWCWAGWWLGNYPGEMLRLLTLISPLTADNGLLSFDQRNLVNIQHSLTVIKTVEFALISLIFLVFFARVSPPEDCQPEICLDTFDSRCLAWIDVMWRMNNTCQIDGQSH